MTPVTRYWEEFILWEKTDAYPIRQFNQFGVQEWKYVYKFKGRNYTTGISGGPSARRVTFLDLPEGLYIPPSQRDAHWVKERYTRTKVVQLPPRDQTIQLYVNPQLGKDFFYPNMEYLYTDENLFFPVALQIGMIAFFIAVRYK